MRSGGRANAEGDGVASRDAHSTCGRIALVLSAVLWAGAVSASDGAIEINQAKALAGGVTPGDPAGFPVIITQPGSYRLTSNLDRTGAALNVHTIDLYADDVTIDLGGFELRGGAECTGLPVTACTNVGTGIGIAGFNVAGVTIRNGTIRGMPSSGVRITGEHSRIDGVTAVSNGMHGIDVGSGLVVDSVAGSNFEDGIVSSSGTVQRSVARTNRADGITSFIGQVMNCNSNSNGGFGLNTSSSRVGYGGNFFACNNSGGLCNNVAQVSGPAGIEIGVNQCGDDTVCP